MQTADDFFSNRGFFFGKKIKFNKVNMNGLQQADTNIYCEAFEAFLESCREFFVYMSKTRGRHGRLSSGKELLYVFSSHSVSRIMLIIYLYVQMYR